MADLSCLLHFFQESHLQQLSATHPSTPIYLGRVFQISQHFSFSTLDFVPFFPPCTLCKLQSLLCIAPSGSSTITSRREQFFFISTYSVIFPNTIPCFFPLFSQIVIYYSCFYQSNSPILFPRQLFCIWHICIFWHICILCLQFKPIICLDFIS